MKVCWISAGVSSFIAGWLVRDTVDEYIYIDIADQHPDSMRFIKDCEKALGKPIQILRSEQYHNVEECIRVFGVVRNVHNYFYPCTNWLKKRVRKRWEEAHEGEDITYVWGMDMNEQHRADRLVEGMPQFEHEFPLIDKQLTKAEAHGILASLGIKRPVMYDMGYSNNNCVGCVRGVLGTGTKSAWTFRKCLHNERGWNATSATVCCMTRKARYTLTNLTPTGARWPMKLWTNATSFA